MRGRAAPPGYERLAVGRAELVALPELLHPIADILARETMISFAASRPDRHELSGRGVAYAVTIPGTATRAVVRHNRHGGLLARLTGDLFVRPTRAPMELEISRQLIAVAIPTPRILAYAVYDVGGGLARSDVVTGELAPSMDLGDALGAARPDTARHAALRATATLVATLSRFGAYHRDLNVKNVLLAGADDAPSPYVLDVDRITFGNDPREALRRNLDRLERSARKHRDRFTAAVSDADLAWLREKAATI